MSFIDKAKNTAEKVAGEVKEAVGKATDDKDLQAEGKKDQTKGSLKNTGEDVKDAFTK
ncbi:CsbD family protein [Aeromicrobium sp. CnD17-E]|uniref:CsbD family protein n=1 Tax=Aeromicrobium sp. CnD17-E TaxID=2954487 RepID=UPI002096A920|nr:CsbD family protein [Aeromicrobium sp. CnD17-E]MCO7237865.1 CsbD family protein [Aeromicrobium sp. CnD17-E]